MASKHSLCKLLRESLGLKGSTSHNGIGAYVMELPCTWSEFIAKLETKTLTWELNSTIDEIVLKDEDCVRIVFNPDAFGDYNQLFAHKSQFQNEGHGSISVHMDIF